MTTLVVILLLAILFTISETAWDILCVVARFVFYILIPLAVISGLIMLVAFNT